MSKLLSILAISLLISSCGNPFPDPISSKYRPPALVGSCPVEQAGEYVTTIRVHERVITYRIPIELSESTVFVDGEPVLSYVKIYDFNVTNEEIFSELRRPVYRRAYRDRIKT